MSVFHFARREREELPRNPRSCLVYWFMRMSTGNTYQLAAFLLSHLEGNSSQGIWEVCTIYFSVCNTFATCVLLIKEKKKEK